MSLDNLKDFDSAPDIGGVQLRDSMEALEISHSSREKPAIVVREESTDTTCTLVESADVVEETEEDNMATLAENKLLNSRMLNSDVHSSNHSLISDISSDCSDLEDIYLEPETNLNKTDIAFAEDTDMPFEINPGVLPTFEIDLNDIEDTSSEPGISNSNHSATNHSATNHSASSYGASSHSTVNVRRNSEMRQKLAPTQPKPVSNLTLRHVGMTKSHSSPSLMEIGCFGFRGEDYYRNCAHIVAEARQREKLKDFRGANEMLKAAVEILIAGVQHDPDPMRREGLYCPFLESYRINL